MKVLISTDNVCDMPPQLIEKFNIKFLSLPVTLGDEIVDSSKIDNEFIFKFVEKNKILPKTSAINEFTYAEFFKKQRKHYDQIVHLTISSKMSLCYDNAKKAAEQIEGVFVLDTATLSSGIAVLVIEAALMREKGKTAPEIMEHLKQLRDKVQVSFVIEKLNYLHKGGRCSGVQRLGANLLKLRPSIVSKNGKLVVHKKYKGKMDEVVKNYVLDTLREHPSRVGDGAFVTYSSATEGMLAAAEEALREEGGFENIYRVRASATITSHCGENTLGVIFLKK